MLPEQTKYFIGFLIEGDAAAWHNNLAKNISERFNTWEVHKMFPPHITIFQKFSTNDIDPIIKILSTWIEKRTIPGNITISGFDHFDDSVVFAGIEVDPSSRQVTEELRQVLRQMPTMPVENFPDWNPHATLAYHLSAPEIQQIWQYVSALDKPHFVLPFNNITLFRFENEKQWVVEKVFAFNVDGSSQT